jgi:hypothetical protein
MRPLLVAAVLLSGCTAAAFKPRSADCAARVDACLASCVPGQGVDNERAAGNANDSRTLCERRCDELCRR